MSSVDAKNKVAGADKTQAAVSCFKGPVQFCLKSFHPTVEDVSLPVLKNQHVINCMSPKVITFNSKFHQINKLIYVSLLGFKKTSLMVREMQGERLKSTCSYS